MILGQDVRMADQAEYDAALAGYDKETVTLDGRAKDVYRTGTGPAVIVIHELPGITPLVAEFGRRVAALGLTAVLPDLLGTPGKPPSSAYLATSGARACVSREFHVFALNKSSPITAWLRALARLEHERCGGPGVGVVGMCLTGGFALAMMVDPVVVAPVLSQPATPAAVTAAGRRALGLSPAELTAVKGRVDDGACVLGLRFTGDKSVPAERFERLRQELGSGFVAVEIDSSPGNEWGYPESAHSVLTQDADGKPGSPTTEAMDAVLHFLSERLAEAE